MSRFGQNLRALRERAGLTQEQLARKLGYLRQSPVSQWETGKVELPEADTVVRLAKELGCATTDLMRGVVTPWDAVRGSTDIPTASHEDIRLTDDEVALVRLWRRLPEGQRHSLYWVIEASVHHARRRQRGKTRPSLPPNTSPPAAAPPDTPGRRKPKPRS